MLCGVHTSSPSRTCIPRNRESPFITMLTRPHRIGGPLAAEKNDSRCRNHFFRFVLVYTTIIITNTTMLETKTHFHTNTSLQNSEELLNFLFPNAGFHPLFFLKLHFHRFQPCGFLSLNLRQSVRQKSGDRRKKNVHDSGQISQFAGVASASTCSLRRRNIAVSWGKLFDRCRCY